MRVNGLNGYELSRFADTLRTFDELDLQVEGQVFIPEVGTMYVQYDGVNDENAVVGLEGVE